MVTLDPRHPLDKALRGAVSDALTGWLERRRDTVLAISPDLAPMADRAAAILSGGKRMRPAFCVWGAVAVGGVPTGPDAAARGAAGARLDLLHVSALVHADVRDASDTRRGVPAAHRQFEADHRDAGARGSAEDFGRAGAILLGDLLLVWSVEAFESSGLDAAARHRARPYLDAVRTEVTAGQYLDVLIQSRDPYALTRTPDDVERLVAEVGRVVTFKSASYTVRRPLDIGAAIAGGTSDQHAALAAYGEPLGRAFQWRDDLLGVFGDGELTGKQTGEDLREGKLTLLVARAFAGSTPSGAERLASVFGRSELTADDVDAVREIIVASGAQRHVEDAIERELEVALDALQGAPLTADGLTALRALADAAVRRSF